MPWPEVRLERWFSRCGSQQQWWPQEFVRLTQLSYRIGDSVPGPGQPARLSVALLALHCVGLSLAVVSEGRSPWLQRVGFPAVSSLVEHRFQTCGLQCLWYLGFIPLRHVGSSWSRDRKPCSLYCQADS